MVVGPYLRAAAAQRGAARAEANERAPEARLEEAVGLARAIDLDVGRRRHRAADRHPARDLYRQGQGRGDRRARRRATRSSIVVMDCALSPVQQRNLEKAWSAKVLDRTGLILEIFGKRARTREGTLQVELAHLTYQKSRLVRSWTHLERQRGGFGFLGGPGETQIEADRRMIERAHRQDRARTGRREEARASCIATAASACRIRSSRWSATPTPASRRCSTA